MSRVPPSPFPRLLLGVDPSISATGYAAILASPGSPLRLVASGTVSTTPDKPLPLRAALLGRQLRDAVLSIVRGLPDLLDAASAGWAVAGGLCAVEDFARNAKFRREEMGVAAGAVFIALCHRDAPGSPDGPVLVPPRTAKAAVCPNWYGWSKDLWFAAKMPPPFKRSMPSKPAVNAALWSRFGIRIDDEHAADAACVAIAAGLRAGFVGR